MCPLRRSKRLRCTQAGLSVESSRGQRRANGHWRIRTMERKNLVQWKEKNSTGTGKRKRTWKDGAKSSGRAKTQKTQNQCWNCWKTSRQCKDCWARPQKQSQGQSHSHAKGNDVKGKSGKGGGKRGNSKDGGALVWNQQPSPAANSVASFEPQTETSTTFGN